MVDTLIELHWYKLQVTLQKRDKQFTSVHIEAYWLKKHHIWIKTDMFWLCFIKNSIHIKDLLLIITNIRNTIILLEKIRCSLQPHLLTLSFQHFWALNGASYSFNVLQQKKKKKKLKPYVLQGSKITNRSHRSNRISPSPLCLQPGNPLDGCSPIQSILIYRENYTKV